MRSQYRDTGFRQSLTPMSWVEGDSSCCSTGATLRRAKISPGKSSTGRRLSVANAAPLTILVAPGPIDDVLANVRRRLLVLVYPVATWTADCSLRTRM